MLWLWELRDIGIIGVGLLLSVLALTQTGIALPLVVTAVFAFLTIRHEGTSILDFIRYAAAFLLTKQQYYKLKHQSLPILEQMLETLRAIRDRRLLWSEDIVSLNKKISELSSQNQTLAFLKQNGLVDPDIFISKSNELTRQLRQAKLDKEELMAAEGDATAQRTQELIALLEDGPDFLDHPDTELCGALIAEIIVESNDTLRFRLHNGLELRESIERTVR